MTIIGDAYVRVRGDTSSFKTDSEAGVMSGIGDIAKKAALVLGGAFAIDKGVDFLKGAFDSAAEANRVTAQTAAVIKSTGDASKVSAGQVEELGKAIAAKTGIDHDQIQSGENLLLTFTSIRNETGKNNDIFTQATAVATDMSKALGQDMKSSAIQLGKALNDPTQGLNALRRVGVSFTEQQKEQIKQMQASGNLMGAQKTILAELNKEFGGSAAAQATSVDKLKEKWKEIQEEIGQKLVPIVNALADALSKYLPTAMDIAGKAFGAIGQAIQLLKPFWDQVVAGVEAARAIFKGFAVEADDASGITGVIIRIANFIHDDLLPAFSAVIDWVSNLIDSFRGGGDSIGASGSRISKIFSTLAEDISAAMGAIEAIINTVVVIVEDLWDRFGDHLVEHVKTAISLIVGVVQGIVDTLGGIFDLVKAILTGKWGDAWNALIEIFNGVWEIIKGVIGSAINEISTIIGLAMAGISAAWGLIWHSLATAFTGLWDEVWRGISTAWDNVIKFFTHTAPGALTTAASSLWDGFKQAFIDALNWIIDKINDFTSHLPSIHLPGTHITIEAPTIAHIGKQAGGPASGTFWAGEAGPELVSLTGGSAYVTPAHRSPATTSVGPVSVSIEANFGPGTNADDVVAALRSIAQTEFSAALSDVMRRAAAGPRR